MTCPHAASKYLRSGSDSSLPDFRPVLDVLHYLGNFYGLHIKFEKGHYNSLRERNFVEMEREVSAPSYLMSQDFSSLIE